MPLDLTTLLERNPDLVATDMDGDIVMMSIEKGEYYALDGVGPHIWNLLAAPMSVQEIAARIGDEYEVAPAQCLNDVSSFMEELLRAQVVREHDLTRTTTPP
jgi:hypothetical protein